MIISSGLRVSFRFIFSLNFYYAGRYLLVVRLEIEDERFPFFVRRHFEDLQLVLELFSG